MTRWLRRLFPLNRPSWLSRLERYDPKSKGVGDPIVGKGDCLSPWISDGDCMWIDATLVPRDGDLVAATMKVRITEPAKSDTAMVLGQGGRFETRPVVKLYRETPAGAYLVCNDGWYRIGQHRVDGVVVAVWQRLRGSWLKPPPRIRLQDRLRMYETPAHAQGCSS